MEIVRDQYHTLADGLYPKARGHPLLKQPILTRERAIGVEHPDKVMGVNIHCLALRIMRPTDRGLEGSVEHGNSEWYISLGGI